MKAKVFEDQDTVGEILLTLIGYLFLPLGPFTILLAATCVPFFLERSRADFWGYNFTISDKFCYFTVGLLIIYMIRVVHMFVSGELHNDC